MIDATELATEETQPFEIVEHVVYKLPDAGPSGLFGQVVEWTTEDGQEWTQARVFCVPGDDETHEHFNSEVFKLRRDCDVQPHSDDGLHFPIRVYTAAYMAEQQSEVTIMRLTMKPDEKSPHDMLAVLREKQSEAAGRMRQFAMEQARLDQAQALNVEAINAVKLLVRGLALVDDATRAAFREALVSRKKAEES